MTLDRAYASARQLIDPDADYTVHVRAGNGWQSPGNRDQQELPGLDVCWPPAGCCAPNPQAAYGAPAPTPCTCAPATACCGCASP
ncbi:hypothetical protein [Streptomyces alfalfae]